MCAMQGMRLKAWMLAALCAASLTVVASASGANLHADFSWSPQQPNPGQEVTFTSTSSGPVKTLAWDLDNDSQFDDGSTASVTKTFTDAGNYKVRLLVTDAQGQTSQAEHSVRVASGLQSSFTWSPPSPTTADQITFTSTSTVASGGIRSYDWDLNGDRKFDD